MHGLVALFPVKQNAAGPDWDDGVPEKGITWG
jgi:hypothetical protein